MAYTKALIFGAPLDRFTIVPGTHEPVKVLDISPEWDIEDQVNAWLVAKGENPLEYRRAIKTNVWFKNGKKPRYLGN